MQHGNDHTTSVGTTAGTVLIVLANISSQDYIKTIVLAIIGAVVSFYVSQLLKWLTRKKEK